MKTEDLKKIGLSKSEATLYLSLLKLGASEVQPLIESTGFYKANVYQALERLCEKGIVSRVIEGKKRVYQIQKPESIIEFIKKKKDELEDQEKIARELVKNIESKRRTYTQETAVVLRGLTGIKQIYSDIIHNKTNYLVFGSPKESETLIGDYYWQNIHLKQIENGIKARMIFHKSLKDWKKIVPKEIIDLRFFDEEFEPLTETTIYGTKVAFVVWADNPVTTIINNEHLADSYRQIFNILWKIAKP
ncbi:MAG: helix-turn-helix domain-containing protein [archaeon]